MKTINVNKIFNRKNIVLGILIIIMALSACLFFNLRRANAEDGALDSATANLFMPYTPIEYDNSLSSPQDVFFDNGVLAVIQKNTEVLISIDGAPFIKSGDSYNALQQVKKLSDRYLLVSAQGPIFAIDLSDNQTPYKKTLLSEEDSTPVSFNLFDYKNGVLIGNYGGQLIKYDINPDTLEVTNKRTADSVLQSSPVCIGDNCVYYILSDSSLCKSPIIGGGIGNPEVVANNFSPKKMICKNGIVYGLFADGIYMVDANKKSEPIKLSLISDEKYDLSNLKTPSGFCFRGDNILISDEHAELSTIQEFKIENNSLIYTGYAVASGKTAFNRFGSNVSEIEQNGNMIATLDPTLKIFTLVYDTDSSFYSKDNFKYSAIKDTGIFNGFTPDTFALGTKSVLFINKADKKAKLMDIEKNLLLSEISFEYTDCQSITDVTYQNGKYYISQLKASGGIYDVVIYTATESELLSLGNFTELITIKNAHSGYVLPIMAVDVFNNIYLTNTLNQEKFIYKYSISEGQLQSEKLEFAPIDNVIKLSTDLGGGLFGLTDSGLVYYDQSERLIRTLDIGAINGTISSFSTSIDSKNVYLTFEGAEYIYCSSDLPIYSLDKFTCPNDFIISNDNAKDISLLETYTAIEGAGVYSFNYSKGESVTFDYDKLITLSSPLAFICDFEQVISFGDINRSEIFYILSGKTEDGDLLTAIINSKDKLAVTPEIGAVSDEFAYTTTGVSVYYLPIITKNADHILNDNGTKIILDKNIKFKTLNTVTLFDIEYYYASVTFNDKTYNGYIPTLFTAKVLSKDFAEQKFSMGNVNETKVFSDKELKNEITTLSANTEIRMFEEENGVLRIAYSYNGDWVEGYIAKSAVLEVKNNTLRNIIIILTITVSVCVTSLFFILRKKKQ